MPHNVFSWLFFYLFLGILIALGVVLFFPKRGLLIPALTPKPETFTELYFEDHLNLPKKVFALQPIQFSFTIHNLEGKAMNYPVEISAQDDSSPPQNLPLYQESVVLNDGQTKTVPVTVHLPDGFAQRVKVIVLLKNLNQYVDFWADVMPTATASAQLATSSATATNSAQFQFLTVPASTSALPSSEL